MTHVLVSVVLSTVNFVAQTPPNPPLIAKMEELGSVYVTRTIKNLIVGIDFRPMAGSDPKKIAALVKEFSSMPDLETVLLLGQDVTDEAAEALPASPKLKSIQFFNTKVTDKGLAKLNRFTSLQTFKYTGMGMSDTGMKDLAKIRSLQTIEITDSKITDAGVLALQVLPNLRSLTIENTAATQRSIDQLRQTLPPVEGRRFLR